jgi:uncharacterized protein
MSVFTHPSDLRIDLPIEAITQICRRFAVAELSVFGSVLRDDFRPDSDVDFLVQFENDDDGPWMCKLDELAGELGALLGRTVEVADKKAVQSSENYLRRRHILNSARQIYVAR